MKKIGLTGSIGMGKSTVGRMFAELGAASWSADEAVHRLYAKDGAAVEPVGARFPSVIVDAAVDRGRLSGIALADRTAFAELEAIVHPLVAADRAAAIEAARAAGAKAIVLDVPLLFETGADGAFDAVVVVSAPEDEQRRRVLSRPGMTVEKYEAIRAKQTPDAVKRSRADFIIETSGPLASTRIAVAEVYRAVLCEPPISGEG